MSADGTALVLMWEARAAAGRGVKFCGRNDVWVFHLNYICIRMSS